jgi:hydrocephalus-inducing protein
MLDFGDCFLSYPYTQEVEVVNETDFPARFELLCQEESAKNVYSYQSSSGSGIIMPRSTHKIQIEIQIKRLGHLSFPIFIKVSGKEDVPLSVDISGNGVGPNVEISTLELNWGKIPVLKENSAWLTVTNRSDILAVFTCSTVSDSSVFRVEPLGGSIFPGQSAEIVVTAFLDDNLKFTDVLKIGVQSDGIHEVQLVAKGQGSTIIFDESLRVVDFQDVFSNRECSKEFTMINKGRRTQTIHWSVDDDRFTRKDALSTINQAFEIIPSRFSLKPNGQQIIILKGYSSKAMKTKETLVCQGTIDKDPARRIIVETLISANFINPLLETTPTSLKFISSQTRDDDFNLLSQELVLKNISPLALQISFKCPIPYIVSPNGIDYRLNQDESVKVSVSYDPTYNTNKVSCKEHAKLLVSYAEHPQKDYIELYSEITFPNLTFSTSSLDFGCIPNETEHKKFFVITNQSSLMVEYSWSFLEGSMKCKGGSEDIPIFQIFDVLPLRGHLYPGESENVEVTFYGHKGGSFIATALCDVVGGPKYELKLHGEASSIEYSFDKIALDFGTQMYQEIREQELTLINTGLVSFDYCTSLLPNSSLAQKIMIFPSNGTINSHGKQKISVRFCACVPEKVDDFFLIQIALFEPIKVRVTGVGIFPYMQFNIPRISDLSYENAFSEAKLLLSKMKKKIPQSVENDSEIEAEAERILLKLKTISFLLNLSDEIKTKLPMIPKSKMIGSAVLISKSLQKQGKDKKNYGNLSETSQVIISTYLCSFGNVIRQTSRKKTVKITNRGIGPISFSLDKSILVGTGFSIEPDRVKMLPGYPHHESVEFVVTFQARHQAVGPVKVDLPVSIQGGPTTILSLQADVTLPDLELSSEDIAFGEVLCGLRKTVTIQLYNSNFVPCEWTSINNDESTTSLNLPLKTLNKKKSGLLSVKEFDLIPSSGLLLPGEKSLLQIRFSPTDEKDYDTVVPLKINMNNQSASIRLTGKGIKPTILFEPESINLGPILPCSDGIESKLTIYNPTSIPIEIYSVEFDHVHLEEEELLRNIDTYENNCLYIQPREPGQGLPDYIIDIARQKKDKKFQSTNEIVSKVLGDPTGLGDIGDGLTRNLKAINIPVPDAIYETGFNVIIHGPPFSGKTTQAKKIQKFFGLTYIRIDDLIDDLKEFEPNLMKEKDDDRTSTSHRRASTTVNDDRPTSASTESHHDDEKKLDDLIFSAVRMKFQKEDSLQGFVVDGLESKYASSPITVLKSLLRVIGERRKTVFFHIAVEGMHIREREAMSLKLMGDNDFDPHKMNDLTEEDYDNMTDIERDNYDACLLRQKKRIKDLQDRKKMERKQLEDELVLKLGEKKSDEENSKGGKKKGNTRPISRVPEKQEKAVNKPTTTSKANTNTNNQTAEKGSMSPKTSRKNQQEKFLDTKSERNGGSAESEEYNSRVNMAEFFGEVFVNENTYKRLESYTLTIESIVNMVRDGEKVSTNIRQISSPANVEKKSVKGGKLSVAGAPPSMENNATTSVTCEDTHNMDDNNLITYKDINGSMDEESVFKILTEVIPSNPNTEDGQNFVNTVPPSFLEQIVFFPSEREAQHPLKNFQLISLTNSENEDENANTSEGLTIPNNVPAISTISPNTLKKGKISSKQVEDAKVIMETDDDNDKDGISKYRWILQPKEKKDLSIKFHS